MTLRLILTRHAKSGWDDPTLSDHDRPLDARGRLDAPKIGAWMRGKGYVPDVALVSSARRTQETWERLSREFGQDIAMTTVPGLYHAQAHGILDRLRDAQGACVMIVGHNPGIGEFAERIVNAAPDHREFVDYPTCASLIVGFDATDWKSVDWGNGRVIDFIVPRDL